MKARELAKHIREHTAELRVDSAGSQLKQVMSVAAGLKQHFGQLLDKGSRLDWRQLAWELIREKSGRNGEAL